MGCCETTSIAGAENAEILVCNAELSLNLSEIPSIQFDRMLYRFSTQNYMTHLQFSEFCRSLNINLENKLIGDFYSEFLNIESDLYYVKPLSTLGVLLCQSTKEEKLKILFQNYDDNANMLLSVDEIKQMISDICFISLAATPGLAYRMSERDDKELIVTYRKKLNCMRTAVLNHYTSILFEDSNIVEVSVDEFVRILKDYRISCILNPHNFRNNTMKLLEIIQKAVNATNFVLDEKNEGSKEVYNQIVRINTQRYH